MGSMIHLRQEKPRMNYFTVELREDVPAIDLYERLDFLGYGIQDMCLLSDCMSEATNNQKTVLRA